MATDEEKYFTRDLKTDTVICPAGNTMRRKCTKSDGRARYICKVACRTCSVFRECYHGSGKWKEIDFLPGKTVVKCRSWGEMHPKQKSGNFPA